MARRGPHPPVGKGRVRIRERPALDRSPVLVQATRPQPYTRQCQTEPEVPTHPRMSKHQPSAGRKHLWAASPLLPSPRLHSSQASSASHRQHPALAPPAGRKAGFWPPCCQAALGAKRGPSRSRHHHAPQTGSQATAVGPPRNPLSRRLALFTKTRAKPLCVAQDKRRHHPVGLRAPDVGERHHCFLGPPLTHDDPASSST